MAKNVGESTRRAATGTAITISLRLLSFLGTQWCYRRLDPTTLGRTNVRLELVLSSVLFLSREGFRLALTRNISACNENTAWLTIPVTTFVAVVALFCHLYTSEDDIDFRTAGILYCVAAAIEGCAEPAVLYFLRLLSVAEKGSAEGIAALVKTGTTVVALQYLQADWPVTSFGIAQVAYAITYFVILYGNLVRQKGGKPSWTLDNTFHAPSIRLVVIFTIQGVLKFALTEGDRIVMALLADSYDQGVYAMGSGYGGLAARMILQPLEETARLLFSRLATNQQDPTTSTKEGEAKSQVNGKPKNMQKADPMLEISYTVLVKIVLYVGLLFCCLAVNYTQVLLILLAGRKWGNNPEAVNVLSAFCVYTAFLAWNGMTEAFVYGVATTATDVGKLGVAHTVTGVLFALTAPIAVAQYGTVGLVAANCISMFGRAIFSVHFAARYLAEKQEQPRSFVVARLIRQMFPTPLVLLSFAAAYIGTRASMIRLLNLTSTRNIETGSLAWMRLALEHISVGAAVGIGILSLAFSLERDFRVNLRRLWKGKSD